MKRHSKEQVVRALRMVAEGRSVYEAASEVGVSLSTVYRWVDLFKAEVDEMFWQPFRARTAAVVAMIDADYPTGPPGVLGAAMLRDELRTKKALSPPGGGSRSSGRKRKKPPKAPIKPTTIF